MQHPESQPHALTQHAAFVRRIALGLARDESSADDLTQEAWLAAIERPPRAGGSIRGWLRRVVTNASRQSHRRESRRRAREDRVALGESSDQPDVADQVDREALLRSVVDAVLALEEPYRSTVLDHFYGGRTARQIAVDRDLPLGTVEARLRRAIQRLRADLDRTHRDRRRWSHGLLAITGADTAATAAATSFLPEILMSTHAKVLTSAAIAIGIAVAVALPERAGDDPLVEPQRRSVAAPPGRDADAPTDRVSLEQDENPASETGSLDLTSTSDTSPTAAAVPHIAGVVVDGELRPVAGATVSIVGEDVRPVTDEAGRFATTVAESRDSYTIEATAPRYARSCVTVVSERLESVRIILPGAGGSVTGVVLDPAGRPLPGATVSLGPRTKWDQVELPDGSQGYRRPDVQWTDDDGRFRADHLWVELASVVVESRKHPTWIGGVEVVPAETRHLEIRLAHGADIEGRITDERGHPVADLTVHVGPQRLDEDRSVRTDSAGRFVARGVTPGWIALSAEHPELGSARRRVETHAGDRATCDLTLGHAASIAGRVIDHRGEPASGVAVELRVPGHSVDRATSGADGRFSFHDCPPLPGEVVALSTSPRVALAATDDVRPSRHEIVLSLPDPSENGSITGRVIGLDGGPLAEFTPTLTSPWSISHLDDGAPRDGRFRFHDLPAGSYRLTAWTDELGERRLAEVTLGPGEHRHLGDLELGEPGWLVVEPRQELLPPMDGLSLSVRSAGPYARIIHASGGRGPRPPRAPGGRVHPYPAPSSLRPRRRADPPRGAVRHSALAGDARRATPRRTVHAPRDRVAAPGRRHRVSGRRGGHRSDARRLDPRGHGVRIDRRRRIPRVAAMADPRRVSAPAELRRRPPPARDPRSRRRPVEPPADRGRAALTVRRTP